MQNFALMSKDIRLAGVVLLLLLLVSCQQARVTQSTPTDEPPTSIATQLSPSPNAPEFTPTGGQPISPTQTEPAPEIPATQSNPEPEDTLLPEPTSTTVPPDEPASALELPNPNQYRWEAVVQGLQNPIGITSAGDGSDRLFILEQEGRIRIWQNDVLLPDPFLDILERVGNGGERGLLGLDFHPNYPENGYFFVNYTDRNRHSVIARFQVSDDDPNRADPSSELRLIYLSQPYANHNGGGVEFGPDGFLYLGFGDGGSRDDPHNNGQSTQTMLGKILRIDINSSDPYAIPQDNPFAQGGGAPEIWAYGLRNPWRFSFDALTGDLFIADVGQNAWEEVNYWPVDGGGGANFGWNYREASHSFREPVPEGITLVEPVTEYSHQLGCSVTGGVVYRGQALAEWQGVYLYGDYCSGRIWGLINAAGGWQTAELYDTDWNITSFGVDEQGEIHLVAYDGTLYKLVRAQ